MKNRLALLLSVIGFLLLSYYGYSFIRSKYIQNKIKNPGIEAMKTALPGALLVLTAASFLMGTHQTVQSRRVQTQLNFFNTWLDIKKDIDEFRDLETTTLDANKIHSAESMFRRYYSLIHIEYLHREQVADSVNRSWEAYRTLEFNMKDTFAGRTYKQWWDVVKEGIADTSFIKEMDKLKSPEHILPVK
jgi:hypothetical protein